MKITKVYVDMDDVLRDFIGAAIACHGISKDELLALRSPGVWGLARTLGLSEEDFWAPINAKGASYWADLIEHSWANDLLYALKFTMGYPVTILSSPGSRTSGEYLGKIMWSKKRFGPLYSELSIYHNKFELAKPGRVLIDDSEQNVYKFNTEGGHGILFPCAYGGNHLSSIGDNPLPHVFHELERITRAN